MEQGIAGILVLVASLKSTLEHLVHLPYLGHVVFSIALLCLLFALLVYRASKTRARRRKLRAEFEERRKHDRPGGWVEVIEDIESSRH